MVLKDRRGKSGRNRMGSYVISFAPAGTDAYSQSTDSDDFLSLVTVPVQIIVDGG